MFIVDVVVVAFVAPASAVVFLAAVLALRHKDYPDGLIDNSGWMSDGVVKCSQKKKKKRKKKRGGLDVNGGRCVGFGCVKWV